MKKSLQSKLVIITAVMLICAAVTASDATVVTFKDNSYYWPTWNTDSVWGPYDGNNNDVIGNPNITGGTVQMSNGRLQSITFDYYVSPQNDWAMLAPGNLFLNILNKSNDTNWDYVVDTKGIPQNNIGPSFPASTPNLYQVDLDSTKPANFGTGPYILSGKDNTTYTQVDGSITNWSGYIIRDLHPVAVNFSDTDNYKSALGTVLFSGFYGSVTQDNGTNRSYAQSTYDFTGLTGGGINLNGNNFILGWEMTCANDVVYEKIDYVPEPATMALLGLGLAGLAGVRRKFHN